MMLCMRDRIQLTGPEGAEWDQKRMSDVDGAIEKCSVGWPDFFFLY